MQYRQLGNSGLTVSLVGLGCNNFGGRIDLDATREVLVAALDAGVNFFDTADVYGNRGGSESFMGELLKGRRDEYVLATKFGMDMGSSDRARGSRIYIKRALEASLTRLKTDHIDLYQMHEIDPFTPIEETLSALDDLIHQGKVLYVGNSNFSSWQIADAEHVARSLGSARFISAQNNYNILEREIEAELVPAAKFYGIGILPFYPLAAGLLSGKFRRGLQAPPRTRLAGRPEVLARADFAKIEAIEAFAQQRSMTLLDVAFCYLFANQQVSSVIAGATSKGQVEANVATLEHSLDSFDLLELEKLLSMDQKEVAS